ncbi:Uncharacterised protein [Porphyromonas endodontalis]|nr:Uncharacterised protein [Porphyromonas endodontalis]
MDRLFHIGMIALLGIGFIFCIRFLYKGRNICKTPDAIGISIPNHIPSNAISLSP